MAKKELNVGLLLDTRKFDQALGKVQRKLNRFAYQAQNIGRNLTETLTLPILGVGAAAVKSFADFDKMSKGLEAVAGSAEEAEKQMARLKVLAQNPGIDLNQAVQGTIKLQAVGLAAKEAEETLLQFSKAVTIGGGNAEDLGEVTRQLSQIIAKGAILSSDFRVIQERVPAIGIALKDAFGTSNIELIRKTGISSQDFVRQLTNAIREGETFQKVQGGLANSLDNFRIALTESLVELGRTIDESINLKQVLNDISARVSNAVKAFSNLDDTTKALIVKTGLFAAAIGPAIFAIGKFISIGGSLIATIRLISTTLLGLNPIFLAVTAAAVGLALIIKDLVGQTSTYEKVQNNLNDINKTAAQSIAKQKVEVDRLTETLNDNNNSQEDREKALKRLQSISPKYFENLSIEKSSIEDVTEASNKYNKSLLARAKLTAANEKLVEIERQLLDTQGLGKTNTIQKVGVALAGLANTYNSVAVEGVFMAKNIKKNTDSLTTQRDEVIKLIESLEKQVGVETPGITDQKSVIDITTDTGDIEKTTKALERTKETLQTLNFDEQMTLSGEALTSLQVAAEQTGLLNREARDLGVTFQEMPEKIETAFDRLPDILKELIEAFNSVEVAMVGFYGAWDKASQLVRTAVEEQKSALKAVGSAALGAALEVVRAELKKAVAAQIFQVISKVPFPFNIAIAAGAGAAISGLFTAALAKLKIPGLAKGGIVPPGYPNDTYPAFLTSGETVLPPGKLPSDGNGYIAETRVLGRDLLIMLRREESSLSRIE